MRVPALVVHGLSALAVFGDIVGARLLAASGLGLVCALLLGLIVVAVRVTTNYGLLGWLTYAAGVIVMILVQFAIMSFLLVLYILASRTYMTFLPVRDCPHYFGQTEKVPADD
jgi:hypothetical protein